MVLKVSRGHYVVTTQDLQDLGVASVFSIPAWLIIPNNNNCLPDVVSFGGSTPVKQSGFKFPSLVGLSALACKVDAPSVIPANQSPSIRVSWYNLGNGGIGQDVVSMRIKYKKIGNGESIENGWTTSAWQDITVDQAINTRNNAEFSVGTVTVKDSIPFIIERDTNRAEDTYPSDIFVTNSYLDLV